MNGCLCGAARNCGHKGAHIADVIHNGDHRVARRLLRQLEPVTAVRDTGKRDGNDVRGVGFYRGITGVVGFDCEFISAIASKGVGFHITFQRISVVAAGRYVAAAVSAAAVSAAAAPTAVGVILIAIVRVNITGNAGDGTETALPDSEGLGISGTIHAVMGDPVIILIQSGAGKAAVEKRGRAVKGGCVTSRRDRAAKSLHDAGHRRHVHVAVSRRFNIVEDRIIQLAVIQNIKTEFRFLFCHFRGGRVAEMVYAHGDVVGHRSGIILFKAGVYLIGPVLTAVARADDGKINLAAVGDRVPVDGFLIIRDVNSHQGNMNLTAGIASVSQIGGDG